MHGLGISSATLSVVFAEFEDAVLATGANGRFAFVNGAAEALFGYPSEALTGESVARLLADAGPDEEGGDGAEASLGWPALAERFRRVGGRRSDGTTLALDVCGGPIALGPGGRGAVLILRPAEAVATARDSGSTAARSGSVLDALHRAEQRLQRLFETLPCLIAVIDSEARYLSINAYGASWFGRTPDELIGRTVGEVSTPEAAAAFAPQLRAALAGERQVFDMHMLYPDGITREVRAHFFPDVSADGTVDSVLALVVDVAREHLAERALRDFYAITSDRELHTDGKVKAMLDLGRRIFEMPFAMLARYEADGFIAEHCLPISERLRPGYQVPHDRSFSRVVIATAPAVAIEDASAFGVLTPETEPRPMLSFIGARVFVDDTLFGTLCFGSDKVKPQPFTATHKELVRLFADWVGHELARERDIEELHRVQAELRRLATVDELTGLYNRREFLRLAKLEFERFRRGEPFALASIDADNFKAVNDTLGHQAGDETLISIVAALRQELRPYDILGRVGGEEFAVVLPGLKIVDAAKVGERLRRAVAATFAGTDTEGPAGGRAGHAALRPVTVSIGITVPTASDIDIGTTLNRADAALYAAKAAGRNTVMTVLSGDGAASAVVAGE